MRKISALGVLGIAVLAITAVGFVYLMIIRPSLTGEDEIVGTGTPSIEGTDEAPTEEAEGTPQPVEARIAFTAMRDGDSDMEVYTMRPDGSDIVQLTDNDALDLSPAWSPDGTRIAWLSEGGGQRDVWIMNADGSNPVQITDSGAIEFALAWSPDGTQLAINASSDTGNALLYVLTTGGEERLMIDAAPGNVSWSPDGTKLAFVMYGDHPEEVAIMDMATGEIARPLQGWNSSRPSWSPDGSVIAFAASVTPDGREPGLFVMKADGSEIVSLKSGFNVTSVAFSPTGENIAIYDWNNEPPDGVPQADVYDITLNGALTPITTVYEPLGMDWSADGQYLVFASKGSDGNTGIYVAKRDGSGMGQISEAGVNAISPDWSPLPPGVAIVPEGTATPAASPSPGGTVVPTSIPDDTENPAQVPLGSLSACLPDSNSRVGWYWMPIKYFKCILRR
jgi:Tol biopolymer transport system component